MRKYWLLLFLFLILVFPSFFYKLGSSSLVSYDEAWYAAVAANIRLTHDPVNLFYNGSRFVDHPPAGFWLIALTQTVFGNTEFGSRAAAAILGLLALVLVFILGARISSPAAGLASAIALSSSPWFLYRSRSGNLDITLTFFFLLAFILAVVASKNKKYLPVFGLTLALLFLTKTMVPFTIVPSLVVIFWGAGLTVMDFLPAFFFFLIPAGFWFVSQLINYPGFIGKYLAIGLPPSKTTSVMDNLLLTKTYIHEGIGNWFRWIAVGFPLSLFAKNRYLFSLFIFIVVFLFPFLFSSRGQIWHLIPVQPFFILIFFSVALLILRPVCRKLGHVSLASSLLIVFSLLISGPQMLKNWRGFVDIPAYVSDEAILSRTAADYPYPLYIDDRFLPVAVYYSKKIVNDLPTPEIRSYFADSQPLLLITHQWRLEPYPELKPRYQIIKSDRDMVLVLVQPGS